MIKELKKMKKEVHRLITTAPEPGAAEMAAEIEEKRFTKKVREAKATAKERHRRLMEELKEEKNG